MPLRGFSRGRWLSKNSIDYYSWPSSQCPVLALKGVKDHCCRTSQSAVFQTWELQPGEVVSQFWELCFWCAALLPWVEFALVPGVLESVLGTVVTPEWPRDRAQVLLKQGGCRKWVFSEAGPSHSFVLQKYFSFVKWKISCSPWISVDIVSFIFHRADDYVCKEVSLFNDQSGNLIHLSESTLQHNKISSTFYK